MAAQTVWAIVPVAVAGYLLGGVGHGAKNTLVRAVIQRRVPSVAHGRAFAAYGAARNAAELVATALTGGLLAVGGTRGTLLIAGLVPMLAAACRLAVLGARPMAGMRHLSSRWPMWAMRPAAGDRRTQRVNHPAPEEP
ncbi:MAG: hypothetical protein JHC95_16710 [Solirubrobacteraceae bacterium]|nr:hypothetical protein [Solirubrobacteraceae bacterium]